jgi:hypothetical protein
VSITNVSQETTFVTKLTELARAVHLDTREALHKALLGLGMVRSDKMDHER